MAPHNINTVVMAEPIRLVGFPSLIVTRAFAYGFLQTVGYDKRERGFGSLDYAVFGKPPVDLPLIDEATRDFFCAEYQRRWNAATERSSAGMDE